MFKQWCVYKRDLDNGRVKRDPKQQYQAYMNISEIESHVIQQKIDYNCSSYSTSRSIGGLMPFTYLARLDMRQTTSKRIEACTRLENEIRNNLKGLGYEW